MARGLKNRLLGPIAGLALTAALLGACAPAPGAAATADGRVIGENDVASVVAQLSPYLQNPMTPAQAIQSLVAAPEYLAVAQDAGAGVSEQDAETALADLSAQLEVEPAEFSDATILVTRSILATTLLQQDPAASDLSTQVAERVAGLDVTVSPRYGSWDGALVVAPSYAWIIQPETDAA